MNFTPTTTGAPEFSAAIFVVAAAIRLDVATSCY
jgi:hypothetical protein